MKGLSLVFCAALAACATTDQPEAEMAQARAALVQAAPAAQDAPHEYATARTKLEHAETALQRGHYGHAQLLAEQSEADARLALTVSESVRMQRVLSQENLR